MIYIVHGENTVTSRALIANQQKKLNTSNSIEINLDDISVQELSTHLKSNSLFGDKSFVILNVTGTKGTEEHITALRTKSENTIVIIYSEKNIPKTSVFIKNATNLGAVVRENAKEHAENIFKFVDVLFYKNRIEVYKEYEKLIKSEIDPFYLFTMILYGLRNIAKAIYKSPNFENSSGFTKSKVISQSKGFNQNTIKNLYQKFYNLEKKMKIGEIQPETAIFMGIENVLNSK